MKYEDMSNDEIDLRVSSYFQELIARYRDGRFSSILRKDGWRKWSACNNPSDAWPIIVENNISILFDGDDCEVSYDYEAPVGKFGTNEILTWHIDVKKEEALRAAMICFLKMKDAETNAS